MQRDALWQRMYRSQYFEGGRILTGAISAIDMALYDIVGKALAVPVYQLLGGKHRDYVPCFATTGGRSYEQLIENVNLLLAHDWNVIHIGAADSPIRRRDRLQRPSPVRAPESIGLTAVGFRRYARLWGLRRSWALSITIG